MDFTTLIANGLDVVAKFFGYQTQRMALKNSAPVQAAQVAQAELKAVEKIETAVAGKDVAEMQNELAGGTLLPVCLALSGLAALLLLAGCAGTVIPVIPTATQASFDGTNQNSGFLGFDASGRGVITPACRERYNGLVADYGAAFKPPVRTDAGITTTVTNTFLIDPQYLVDFAT